ncbi:MAG: TrbI F-type domain-containing protein, partial [Proteobacteria bacterium]|nr:TrbI F-type domain-containing protein [Pseudomonadota bacterium]
HNLNRKINSKSEAIVVIDAEKILKELTLNLVRENIGKEELKLRTQESLKKMEVAVSAFKNQGLVILDKKCLIAGALDVTEDIRMVMSRNNTNSVTDGKVILKKQN